MIKSFLKWAGGKSKSAPLISETIGVLNGRLIEPFVGSGVVFVNIPALSYIIGDCNSHLINVFKELKNNGDYFVKKTEELFKPEFNNKETFYKFREQFNKTDDAFEKACLFVYLNKHCFNGLCRYNKKDEFNVPFGKYNSIQFPKKEMLIFIEKLKVCDIYCQDFEQTIQMAKPGDVIYADPPYTPLTATAQFTDYSAEGFGAEQHIRLTKLAEESCCRFLISNHDTKETRELYNNADRIITKNVNRFISGKGEGRKPVVELLAIYEKGKGRV